MPDAPLTDLERISNALADIAEAVGESAVRVESSGSVASGFVWRPNLIVTAEERLADEGKIHVVMSDGARVPATLVGRDAGTDVALLRVDGAGATAAALTTTVPRPGELVLAVGNDRRSHLGVVSVTGEAWHSSRGGKIDARIEIDLRLRGVDEGSLVVDSGSRAFGMAVSGPRRRTLVIPTATIERIATRLEKDGHIARGYLGLGLQPVHAQGDNIPAAIVISTDPNGPAAAAGVHQGDVLVGWDGKPIDNLVRLLRSLGPESIGRRIELTVRRGPTELGFTLTIGERPLE